ncbi:MAG: DNA repair protein RecO [Terrimicrobiaceae bacterium]
MLFFPAGLWDIRRVEHSPAILIRRRAWGDTSWIVTWLTLGHGKVSTMARGARRPTSPFSGKLDLFYIGEISFVTSKKSSLHTLREVQILEPFDASDLTGSNLYLCCYFAELADLVTEPGTPVSGIFDLLNRALAHLKTNAASVRALDFFEKELGRVLGIHDASAHPLAALEAHCGKIPKSRQALLRLLKA